MRVHLRFLRHPQQLRQALQNDGWQLETEKDECLLARHPQVSDEPAARGRLHRLGLLISPSLRIEFRQPARRSDHSLS